MIINTGILTCMTKCTKLDFRFLQGLSAAPAAPPMDSRPTLMDFENLKQWKIEKCELCCFASFGNM